MRPDDTPALSLDSSTKIPSIAPTCLVGAPCIRSETECSGSSATHDTAFPALVILILSALTSGGTIASVQDQALRVNDREYFETRGLNVLVFSSQYNGLFFDEDRPASSSSTTASEPQPAAQCD